MPDTNVAPEAMSPSQMTETARSTAILASVTLGLWAAERGDKGALNKGAGRVVRNLMDGADASLKDVRAAFAAVRAQHYALTLPWVSDTMGERMRGPRLLPNALLDRYLTLMGTKKRHAMAALDVFASSYPEDMKAAMAKLGDKVTAEDYPDPEHIKAHFRINVDFDPLPSPAQFTGLPDAMLARLCAMLERKQGIMVERAMDAMWQEVHERLDAMIMRLREGGRFKAVTITGVQEIADLLPAWNIIGDPLGDEVSTTLTAMLIGADPATIRTHDQIRNNLVQQATALKEKLMHAGR